MSEGYDLIVRNATVIDGTRAPRFEADVGVRGDRITSIGRLKNQRARREIDATGKILSPGFIDAHTHDDRLMLSAPEMAPKASQGVTTVIAGNCGISLAPLTLPDGRLRDTHANVDDQRRWQRPDHKETAPTKDGKEYPVDHRGQEVSEGVALLQDSGKQTARLGRK